MKEKVIAVGKTKKIICFLLWLLCFSIICISSKIVADIVTPVIKSGGDVPVWFFIYAWIYVFALFSTIVIFTKMANSSIIVTDKKIYITTMSRHVFMPFNKIEKVTLINFKGIKVKTKKETFKVFFIKNNKEIKNAINKAIDKELNKKANKSVKKKTSKPKKKKEL